DAYPLVRRRAAEALGKLGDASAVEALVGRVADGVWMDPRRLALTGGRFADEFADPAWGGKSAALAALRGLAPGRGAEAPSPAGQSDNANVRAWAAGEF